MPRASHRYFKFVRQQIGILVARVVAVAKTARKRTYTTLIREVRHLLRVGEALLHKADEACREARKARDGVMLLIKFIRESHQEALAASEQDKEKEDLVEKDEMPKHVPGNPRAYLDLFDPRTKRSL